ncbi:MAG: hypothetical protein WC584_02645 [Candidatus Pacearchaeota archaeon]
MSYKNKTNTKIECPIDLGVGYNCVFIHKECEYRNKTRECLNCITYFISNEERIKIEEKGLAEVVNALGLNKLNRKSNGKFKN